MGPNRIREADGAAPPRAADAPARHWGWWGIVFVVAFVASIVAGSLLKVGESLYLPDASVAQLRGFYATSAVAVLVQSALQILSAVALYRFGWRLRAALRTEGTRAGAVLGWGTAITAGSLLASVVCGLVLLLVAARAGDTTVAALGRAALLLGGAAHLLGAGLLITAASAVARGSHRRPRWVFGYGRVVGPLVAASALSILVPPLVRPEPAFRLLAAVWLVGMGVGVLRRAFDEVGQDVPA
ncbi:hypothetical protein [Micromonospora sp. MA102]|uniref:hypothetical protein n=1 Tax=Micromonospora sp. MA102 TaxID=2952755 RepID=UPI0021C65B49|nr:hypothetical protein [Micromonospora sp. MA102]